MNGGKEQSIEHLLERGFHTKNFNWRDDSQDIFDVPETLESPENIKDMQVRFSQPEHLTGWIEMEVTVDNQVNMISISIVSPPFTSMLAFLETLISNDQPVSFGIDEEGNEVIFQAIKTDNPDTFNLRITGCKNENIEGIFHRKQFVTSFVTAFQSFLQDGYHKDSWTQLSPGYRLKEEDLNGLNLEAVLTLLP